MGDRKREEDTDTTDPGDRGSAPLHVALRDKAALAPEDPTEPAVPNTLGDQDDVVLLEGELVLALPVVIVECPVLDDLRIAGALISGQLRVIAVESSVLAGVRKVVDHDANLLDVLWLENPHDKL